jgi:hypothetical protein
MKIKALRAGRDPPGRAANTTRQTRPGARQSAPTPLVCIQSLDTVAFAMDLHSLLAIALFGALQVAMYLVCLGKIRSIDALSLPPLVKLRLMENEENLFDGGLYLGIGGTATALVLQVLGLVEPNLLAAYSSNLLGITCVALVKIRHVRPYKTNLILAAQDAIAAGDSNVPRAASTR